MAKVSNPTGKTGRRGVHYVSPGHTRVIYEDRVLDVKFKETPLQFGEKICGKEVRENNMAYVDDATARKYTNLYYDSVEKRRSAGAKKAAKTRNDARKEAVKGMRAELSASGVKIPRGSTDKQVAYMFKKLQAEGADALKASAKGKKKTAKKGTAKGTAKKTASAKPAPASAYPSTIEELQEANARQKRRAGSAPTMVGGKQANTYRSDLNVIKKAGYPLARGDNGAPFKNPGEPGWKDDAQFAHTVAVVLRAKAKGARNTDFVLKQNGGVMVFGA